MRKAVALVLGVLMPLLGFAGVGHAQSGLQVQGTIEAVDCQAQTVVIATQDSTNTIAAAPYTAVLVDSQAVSLCDLQQYIGSSATVWLVANGNEFVATRIETAAPAAPAVAAGPGPIQAGIDPLPIAGIVLGTIAVAGLIYLLVRDGAHYYRYPYYGPYYSYYYSPLYQPYYGYYPPLAPILFAPAVITGFVLGFAVFDGLDYLIVRERDGRFARYPYFGPYRAHYYRPEYRQYAGPAFASYRNAPVRYGDWRNSGATYRQNYAPVGGPRQQPRSNNNYSRGPAQQYQRPNYNYNNNYNRGPAQQYQRPNYNYNNNYNRGPAQQYQRPNYNRGGGYGGGGQGTRRDCNGQGNSCSNR
jgi:hypothetical protein